MGEDEMKHISHRNFELGADVPVPVEDFPDLPYRVCDRYFAQRERQTSQEVQVGGTG